jgi:ELWxxDGT repeat protein
MTRRQNLMYLSRAVSLLACGFVTFLNAVQGGSSARLIKDINQGTVDGNPVPVVEFNGQIFFRADSTNGISYQLWVTDGSAQGTFPAELIHSSFRNASNPTKVGSNLYYWSTNVLWISDGTSNGTVRTLISGSGFLGSTTDFAVANNFIYFAKLDGTFGWTIWVANKRGTATNFLKAPRLFNTSPYIMGTLHCVDDRLVFLFDDGINGTELWVSDGSSVGTHLLKNIGPGSFSAGINSRYVHQGILYFSADDGNIGSELWRTDGTELGTFLLRDINPRSAGSAPTYFTA